MAKKSLNRRRYTRQSRRRSLHSKILLYKSRLEKLEPSFDVDVPLLTEVTRSCGPSIYNRNASIVASSNKGELLRVKRNFLIDRLGLEDSPELDKAISDVVEVFGSGHRQKDRAIFYYLLIKKLGLDLSIMRNSSKSHSILVDFGKNLIDSQEDIDPEIGRVLDDSFFELL